MHPCFFEFDDMSSYINCNSEVYELHVVQLQVMVLARPPFTYRPIFRGELLGSRSVFNSSFSTASKQTNKETDLSCSTHMPSTDPYCDYFWMNLNAGSFKPICVSLKGEN